MSCFKYISGKRWGNGRRIIFKGKALVPQMMNLTDREKPCDGNCYFLESVPLCELLPEH